MTNKISSSLFLIACWWRRYGTTGYCTWKAATHHCKCFEHFANLIKVMFNTVWCLVFFFLFWFSLNVKQIYGMLRRRGKKSFFIFLSFSCFIIGWDPWVPCGSFIKHKRLFSTLTEILGMFLSLF